MAAMTEQMEQNARKQQKVRQCPEQMGTVLGEKKEDRNRQKAQQHQSAVPSRSVIS